MSDSNTGWGLEVGFSLCVLLVTRSERPIRHSGALSPPPLPFGQESTHASEAQDPAPSVWWTLLLVSNVYLSKLLPPRRLFFRQWLLLLTNYQTVPQDVGKGAIWVEEESLNIWMRIRADTGIYLFRFFSLIYGSWWQKSGVFRGCITVY